MSFSQTYFYPAASFPSTSEQQNVEYNIEGELVNLPAASDPTLVEAPPLPPLPNPYPEGCEIDVPTSSFDSVAVPVATPLPTWYAESSSQTATNSGDGSGGGVHTISTQDAISIMQTMQAQHPDTIAVTTSVPSSTTSMGGNWAPFPSSSDTLSTMGSTSPSNTTSVVDSATQSSTTTVETNETT
jgi:hypothetical protein